ncbi:MAG TPA: RNA-binding domain-containing protein [Methanothrix sp.]|nr:RNA-binding domain-containing protein [Methanothrix sp.]HPJ84363.1 RNA-binding domain-containing protein [Methanothrix sp.]HPR67573.1 RNA-binding domain-containing protein [Methanothrix sp.]
MIELSLAASVRPTESPEKVAGAVENLFPKIELVASDNRIEGRGGAESLLTFHRLLREQRILDTARSVMLQGRVGDAVQFRLNKQAATVSRINFPPEEEPLGSIHVQIRGPETLIDWLAPRTSEGKPVEEIELEDDHV